MAATLRERCSRRLAGLKSQRQPYEAEWREIASYAQPARSRFLSSDANKNVRQRNAKLNSSHPVFAFRTLQGGMTSGLSSPSRPWFGLTTFDENLMEDAEAKTWLAEVERRIYAFLAQTNFYGAVKTGYAEMGLFGTEACVMVEHDDEGAVCHQLTAGEYWLGVGSSLTPEALYRRCPWTVNQAVQTFGNAVSPRIRGLYDKSQYDEVVNYYQAIEINDERDIGRLDAEGMPYRSVYWDEDVQGEGSILSKRGYPEQPFWAPRWDTTSSDAWGNGPGSDALADMRELYLQVKRKGEATDLHLYPPIVVPARLKFSRNPKAVNSAASVGMGKVEVPYEVPYSAIQAIREDIVTCEEAINRAAYADLFMSITNMQGIQPRNIEEIASRNEEKLTQLGPVIERVNNEKLDVAIERAFAIMERKRLLPPAPASLAEQDLKIEFVSILTQMQRMVGLGQVERTISFAASLMPIWPEVRHKFKIMEVIDEYAGRAGAPQNIILPTGEAEQLLAAEQQAAQAAQMAEMASKMAPAAGVAVDAARLASEIPQSAPPEEVQLR